MLMRDDLSTGYIVQVKIKRSYDQFCSNDFDGDDEETECTNIQALRRCGYIGKIVDFDDDTDDNINYVKIVFNNDNSDVIRRELWFTITEIRCIIEPKVLPIRSCWISWWYPSKGYMPLKVPVIKSRIGRCSVKLPDKLALDLKEITVTKWYKTKEECQKACDEQVKEEKKIPTL